MRILAKDINQRPAGLFETDGDRPPKRALMDLRLTPPRKEKELKIQIQLEIEALRRMTVRELRERYREVFGRSLVPTISSFCVRIWGVDSWIRTASRLGHDV